MTLRDMAAAALVSIAWGFGFVAIKLGLDSFSAPQLTAIRFLIACLPVLLVPRPRIPWSAILLIGLTLFAGQFILLFFAFSAGMPPGLASVTQQMQAFFTILLAAVFLRDVPTSRQIAGATTAFIGLALVGLTLGADVRPVALLLALSAAFSWAIGNVLVRRLPPMPMFPLVVWCSLVPPLPAIALSIASDPAAPVLGDFARASWLSIAAALYLGVVATVLAYAAWGSLLQRYPAALVAPFALLAPCTGVLSSALIFGEVFSPLCYAGMALIFCGLLVILLPGVLPATAAERDRRSP